MGAGNTKNKRFIPDLTDYRRAILLHGITLETIEKMVKEYAKICIGDFYTRCKFYIAPVPGDNTWIYMEFPYAAGIVHTRNFYDYQNLMIWLSDKTDKEFCLAIPKDQNQPLFFSEIDKNNMCGDSVMGVFADRDFYFTVPGEEITWQDTKKQGFFDWHSFFKKAFGFDTKLLLEMGKCKWEEFTVKLPFENNCRTGI